MDQLNLIIDIDTQYFGTLDCCNRFHSSIHDCLSITDWFVKLVYCKWYKSFMIKSCDTVNKQFALTIQNPGIRQTSQLIFFSFVKQIEKKKIFSNPVYNSHAILVGLLSFFSLASLHLMARFPTRLFIYWSCP